MENQFFYFNCSLLPTFCLLDSVAWGTTPLGPSYAHGCMLAIQTSVFTKEVEGIAGVNTDSRLKSGVK
jgi:hypothetical protein